VTSEGHISPCFSCPQDKIAIGQWCDLVTAPTPRCVFVPCVPARFAHANSTASHRRRLRTRRPGQTGHRGRGRGRGRGRDGDRGRRRTGQGVTRWLCRENTWSQPTTITICNHRLPADGLVPVGTVVEDRFGYRLRWCRGTVISIAVMMRLYGRAA
jgi:hypothetical protein